MANLERDETCSRGCKSVPFCTVMKSFVSSARKRPSTNRCTKHVHPQVGKEYGGGQEHDASSRDRSHTYARGTNTYAHVLHNTTQPTQHNATNATQPTQHNATQPTQHNTTNTTQHNTTQHNTTQPTQPTQHNTILKSNITSVSS